MAKRRSRGDGGLHWDEKRQRWIATANLGFDPSGKRIVKRGVGRPRRRPRTSSKRFCATTKTVSRSHPRGECTVADAVNDWLAYGLAGRDQDTVEKCTQLKAVP